VRIVSDDRLRDLLAALPGIPRAVAAGNFATPWRALAALGAAVPDASTVMPRLTGPATSFQHSSIVSEQGTAAIWGHDTSAQAEQIISQVAHSRGRGELREAGSGLGFRV
jgi:Acetyl-CoA hydrolase/transferase C-terminal domain